MAPVRHINPDFAMDDAAIDAEASRMAANPVSLARPVVILGGWHSPGMANWGVASQLRPWTSGREADFLSVTYPWKFRVRSAAEAAMAALRAKGLDAQELDLIGVSMGGLVARGLASDHFGLGRLKVARVITLATPHRGAKIARYARLDSAAIDMRPGSAFLGGLNATLPSHELHCYGALRDWWIGAANTSPPGMDTHWTDIGPGFRRLCTHFAINHERIVLLDIARRLRGEAPISQRASKPPID